MNALAAFAFASVPLLIQLFAKQYQEDDWRQTAEEIKTDLNLPKVTTYDFIVVGAGSAGCIVANRLQQYYNVLLIEAGGYPVPATEVPFLASNVAVAPNITYRFPSVPQAYASLSAGGVVVNYAGKMLGGTGSHNGMNHNRGSPYDYDNYARILNDPTWAYSSVLKYFKKFETFIGRLYSGKHTKNYGTEGPITVDTEESPFLPKWFQAGEELGFKIGDPNGYQQESFAPVAKTIRKGRRSSSFEEYIKPIMTTKNSYLTVHQYSIATRILIDDNKKAYGVLYERHGIPQIALASKEVIISGGTYSSPLLLMKSGVGPIDQLEAAGIPVKVELPHVGQNLQNHIRPTPARFTFNSSALPYLPTLPNSEEDVLKALKTYEETGEGFLGEMFFQAQAYLVSNRAKWEGQENWPDLQLHFQPMCHSPLYTVPDTPTACIHVVVTRPKSRGSISLNATAYKAGLVSNDEALAIVDWKLFEGEDGQTDVDVLIDGIQDALAILNTTAFQSVGATLNAQPVPGCVHHKYLSLAYWRCLIEQTGFTMPFPVGTCAMGSVVDSQFRVHEIEKLRVVDASVLPVIPNANPNAAVMMLAEKSVDDILQDWGHQLEERKYRKIKHFY